MNRSYLYIGVVLTISLISHNFSLTYTKRLVMTNDKWSMYLKNKYFFLLSRVLQVTSAASDPELGFTIISCSISPKSNPSVPSDYTLIQTVCPTDDSIKYYPQREFPAPHAQPEKKIFSFTFNSKLNMSLLFLHCEMSLCAKRSQSNQRLPLVGILLFCCMFNDFTVQAISFFASPEVCSISSVCLRRL